MIKTLLTLLFVMIIGTACFSQSGKISFEYKDLNLKSVVLKLDSETKYKFYYIEKWFEKDSTLASNSFVNEDIEVVLEKIFRDSNYNFYINSDKIILTKNQYIYTELPNELFQKNETPADIKDSKKIIGSIEKPPFEREFESGQIQENLLQYIGKEQKSKNNTIELSGTVYDPNRKIIPFLTIKVQNTTIKTTTNEAGFYKLQVPYGLNIIETESDFYIKYSREIVAYSSGKLNINLEHVVNLLKEVVINQKAKDKIATPIIGITTIDVENIKNIPLVLGERDIFKVATILPGIKTTGEGSAGFNVRGGKEDQNLILLDKAVIYNPSHFFGFFSAVNPFSVRKVDIYKGSIPAEFGGRLSSVFDISSKTGNKDKISGEGGIGPVTSNLMVETPIVKGKSSLFVAGRATYSDWILRSLKNEKLKKSEASFYDLMLKYDHNFNSNNNVSATAYYSSDKYSITSDSLYNYSNRLISLNWQHKFSDKLKTNTTLTNSEYVFKINYESNLSKNFDFQYSIGETQFISNSDYKLNDFHTFKFGLNSKLYLVKPGDLTPIGNSILTPVSTQQQKGLESAIFVSDNIKISEKFSVNVGVRYSNFLSLGKYTGKVYDENLPKSDATVIEIKEYGTNEIIKSYGGIEPRIAARYYLMDDLSIKASYDKANQFIHLLSSNTTQSPTDTWKLSDLNVKPQIAEQFSLGLFKNIDKSNLELSLEGYFKKTKNFLDYKVGADLLLNPNIETELLQGEGKAYGIEVLLKKTEGKLNGWIGYTYSRSLLKLNSKFNEEIVNNGSYFPSNFDKPHDVSVVLNYKFTKRYSFSSNFIYQTGRPITYPVGSYEFNGSQYTLYSDRNKFRIPDYYRLDVGFNIEGNHRIKKLAHSFINISIYNVLGINNPYSIYFVTDEGKIKAYKTSIFSIPIPSVTYNFKF